MKKTTQLLTRTFNTHREAAAYAERMENNGASWVAIRKVASKLGLVRVVKWRVSARR